MGFFIFWEEEVVLSSLQDLELWDRSKTGLKRKENVVSDDENN